MVGMLQGAWRYRYLSSSSIRTELRIKFARSRLGGLWMILNSLAQVVIFAFILSAVLSAKLPGIGNRYAYALYLMAGTLGWSLFADIVTRCLTLFIDNGNILKKLAFPKIALPLVAASRRWWPLAAPCSTMCCCSARCCLFLACSATSRAPHCCCCRW